MKKMAKFRVIFLLLATSMLSACVYTSNVDYVRISVIAIACFGLFRSPDPTFFLSSYFYSK
ncbi:hypothetical protein FCV65_00290 [Vibrio sp. F13]|nr:hypothetical protein FCV65_00290 [Vibrio sp. F13]